MKLPISFNEVIYGELTKKVLEEGDVVTCKRCGKKIRISPETVKGKNASDADVVCSNVIGYNTKRNRDIKCGYRCFALYYARKVKA